jgi:hypothetical protein
MFKGGIFIFNMNCFGMYLHFHGGVGGYSIRLEPAHMVKPFDKNRW